MSGRDRHPNLYQSYVNDVNGKTHGELQKPRAGVPSHRDLISPSQIPERWMWVSPSLIYAGEAQREVVTPSHIARSDLIRNWTRVCLVPLLSPCVSPMTALGLALSLQPLSLLESHPFASSPLCTAVSWDVKQCGWAGRPLPLWDSGCSPLLLTDVTRLSVS